MDARHDPVCPKRVVPGGVVEAERRVPVRAEADVVVCGGGPAGVGAARGGVRPRDVDGTALRAALAQRGARFLDSDARLPGL